MPAFADLCLCRNRALTNTSDKVVWNMTMIESIQFNSLNSFQYGIS